MSLAAETGLDRLIQAGSFGGVFFFHGSASRLRNEGARRLIDAAADPNTRDFNLDMFAGADVTAEALASSLATPPVMAERRVVALFGAEGLGTNARKVVEQALANLPTDITFVITATIPDRSRAALYGKLKKSARCFEWSAPRPAEIPGWIIARAADVHGLTIDAEAAQHIAAAIGPDLGSAVAELEKLAAAGHERVSGEIARALVPARYPVDRWTWLDQMARREYANALSSVPALLALSSESAVGLIAGLLDHHLCLAVALEGGASAVTGALGDAGKPYLKWKARVFADQARGWNAEALDHAVRTFATADRQAKSGLDDLSVMRNTILQLQVAERQCV